MKMNGGTSWALVGCMLAGFALHADVVSRDIGDPSLNTWKEGDWVTCGGEILAIDERPAEAPSGAKALRLKVNYLPKKFGGWNAAPLVNEYPGTPVKLTAWMRLVNDVSTGFEWAFEDAAKKRFKVEFKRPDGGRLELTRQWQRCEAQFPKDLKPPVKLVEVGQNNWGADQNPDPWYRALDVYDLRLHVEMGDMPAAERPCGLSVNYPVEGCIYFHGVEEPRFTISAYSWTGGENLVTFEAKTVTSDGCETPFEIAPLKVAGSGTRTIDLPAKEPGAYKVVIAAKGFPKDVLLESRYVMCLPHRDLSPEEKRASFYGINAHGGDFIGYARWGRLGFSWMRDYAYTFDWMKRARGAGDYGGWPWYPKLVKGAEDAGLLTLACLMQSPRFPDDARRDNPLLVPDNEWRRDLALIVSSFPQIPAFELDNELDLRMKTPWEEYGAGYAAYHRTFAEVVKACRPDAFAVSQGAAGIHVGRDGGLVKDGSFAQIDVVNGHHYCGVVAPEESKSNLNTGMGKAGRSRLVDVWRRWRTASESDGRRRQLWLTEWGFDTLAGHVVSEHEQAAYGQREWLLGMQGGLDKMFWYWLYDTKGAPRNFFDGCGLYDGRRYPKPAACAFAALRAYIPGAFRHLGYAQLGPNHMAHLVEAEGRVLAAAFKIDGTGPDLKIDDPRAERITDMYGRALSRGKRTLDVGPTWYVGLAADCEWLRQCPIDLVSEHYVRAVAGEPVRIVPANLGSCRYDVKAPAGWTVTKTEDGFEALPSATLAAGTCEILVTGTADGARKAIPIDVELVPLAATETFAATLDGDFKVEIANQSSAPHSFTLKAELPAGWKVEPATFDTGSIAPSGRATAAFKLVSTAALRPGEAPRLGVYTEKGDRIDALSVVPREALFHALAAGAVKLDGDLSDWPKANRLGDYLFGAKDGEGAASFYAGWCEEGLYLAVDVKDSKCVATDPEWFWSGADCWEIGVDTAGRVGKDRAYADTDSHFWFCPQRDAKRLWTGRWGHDGRKTLKDADLGGVKSAVTKTAAGYVAEVFVPASVIAGWQAKDGAEIGFCTSLIIQGRLAEDTVCWPVARRREPFRNAGRWSRVKLVK